MKSFQRRWKGLEITIVAVLVLLLLLLAYLNWAIAILALIIVVAAYLVNYNTLHNRRRLAREQFSAMMKNVTQASNFALQNLPMGIVLVNKQGTLVWNNSVFADWVKVDWNKLQKMSALLPGFRIDKIWGKSGYMTEKYENRYFQIIYKFICEDEIKKYKEYLSLSSFEINKDKTFKNIEKKLVNTYEKAAYDFVRLSEIDFNEEENIVRDVLNVLVDEEKIVKINDEMFTLKSLMDKVEILVKEKLAQDNLITISQLRDALNTSRKSAKPMLEYLDNMKITRKNGTESERVGY